MSFESVAYTRNDLADVLTAPISSMKLEQPARFGDMTLGEFVASLRERGRVSLPAQGDPTRFLVASRPKHWRFLVPAAGDDLSQLTEVSFGLDDNGNTVVPRDDWYECAAADVDWDIDRSCPLTPIRSGLCRPLIEDIARRVSMSGQPFFAGMEWRVPLHPTREKDRGWSQLIFSHWLLRSADLLQAAGMQHPRYKSVPGEIWSPLGSTEEARRLRGAQTLATASLMRTLPLDMTR